MNRLTRLCRHLFAPLAERQLPEASLQRVTQAITAGERAHGGEICFAVEAALPLRQVLAGVDARARALEVFSQLRVWDTEGNNGVLAYLLLADHRIEIVADRGLDGRVSASQWHEVCGRIEERLRAGQVEAAAIEGVAGISRLLGDHFPPRDGGGDINELQDRPQLL